MQTNEKEVQVQPDSKDSKCQPLPPVPLAQDEESDDPEQIFLRAVAEIDTQPLPRRTRITVSDIVQTIFCVSLKSIACAGIVWQAITYPHTLVILYARETPVSITATLDIQTRTLAPVTLTRSATMPTTGQAHQDARQATGTLTFYNGSYAPQTINAGTVYTGKDGIQVVTDQTVTIPAAIPPQFGEATIPTTSQHAGAQGNIQAFDLTIALSNFLTVKNLTPFTGGSNARDFQAVAKPDLDTLTTSTTQRVNQAMPQAFILRKGDTVQITACTTKTTADRAIGDEAQSVTVTMSKTCAAVAYGQDDLTHQATVAFTQTRPAANYHIIGSVLTTIQSVSPFSVTIKGSWAFTFSTDYKQYLAENIAGETPRRARAYLLKTGVIAQASVPNTLPSAMYIDFFVLS